MICFITSRTILDKIQQTERKIREGGRRDGPVPSAAFFAGKCRRSCFRGKPFVFREECPSVFGKREPLCFEAYHPIVFDPIAARVFGKISVPPLIFTRRWGMMKEIETREAADMLERVLETACGPIHYWLT